MIVAVTLNKSAGTVLRLLTVTRTTRISFTVRSFGRVRGQMPRLTSLGPSKGCIFRSLCGINKIPTIRGCLLSGNLLRNSYLAMAKGALTRGLRGITPLTRNRSIVVSLRGPGHGSNPLVILGNGLTPSNTIMGISKLGRQHRRKPTGIFGARRTTVRTALGKRVISNSIIIIHFIKPGNKPKVPRVLSLSDVVSKGNVGMYLVASNHFSNNSRNFIIKRVTPRTRSNKPVTLLRASSAIVVSRSAHRLAVGMSSRRLTGQHRGLILPPLGSHNILNGCTRVMSSTSGNTMASFFGHGPFRRGWEEIPGDKGKRRMCKSNRPMWKEAKEGASRHCKCQGQS